MANADAFAGTSQGNRSGRGAAVTTALFSAMQAVRSRGFISDVDGVAPIEAPRRLVGELFRASDEPLLGTVGGAERQSNPAFAQLRRGKNAAPARSELEIPAGHKVGKPFVFEGGVGSLRRPMIARAR